MKRAEKPYQSGGFETHMECVKFEVQEDYYLGQAELAMDQAANAAIEGFFGGRE